MSGSEKFRNMSHRAALALAACIAFSPAAALAQSVEYVVFEISNAVEGLSPGNVLKEGDILKLPENVEVKLLSKVGEVLSLKGPLEGTITNEGDNSESALNGSNALLAISNLVFKKDDLVNTLGAARSLAKNKVEKTTSFSGGQDPWKPTLTKSGDYCILMDQPDLARVDSTKAQKVLLVSSLGKNHEIDWPANEEAISLSDVLEDGVDRFTFLLNDKPESYRVHLLDAEAMSTTEQIGWMAEKGCTAQAMKLLTQAAKTASSQ